MGLNGLHTELVNVTDPSFAVSTAYAPNKTDLWKSPIEQDGWIHAHNAIRGELRTMKQTLSKLASLPLKSHQVMALRCMWNVHKIHIIDHHSNEDDKFTPWMQTRIRLPEKLTTAHAELNQIIDNLSVSFEQLSPGSSTASAVCKQWTDYESFMLPHLHEEEQVSLPLLRAFFTQEEAGKKVGEILSKSPPLALGAFWYWLNGKAGDKKTIMAFMAQEGIPYFVYYIAFKKQLTMYTQQFVEPMMALQNDVDWSPKESSSCAIL